MNLSTENPTRIAKAIKAGNVQLGEIPTGMRNRVNHELAKLDGNTPVESKPVVEAPKPKAKATKNASKKGKV